MENIKKKEFLIIMNTNSKMMCYVTLSNRKLGKQEIHDTDNKSKHVKRDKNANP